MTETTTTAPAPIKKGDVVYKATADKSHADFGKAFTVQSVRASASKWRKAPYVFLVGERGGAYDGRLVRVSEVTPEEEAVFAKARAKRERVAAKEQADAKAASDHEKAVLLQFADKLRAEPERMGPVGYAENAGWSKLAVGCYVRFWRQERRGFDTVVAQKEEWVGVRIETKYSHDPVTNKSTYAWALSFGGTTYSQFEAAIIAEAVQHAITAVIPTLGDPRPVYDRD